MKILFVCENYYPHYGGAEVLFKNLAEGFSKKGHQVSVLTHRLKNTPKKENINQVEVQRVSSAGSRYVFTFFSLFQAIKMAEKHDLIQTTTFNGAFPAWLAGKLTGKPVVLTVHEVWAGRWRDITGFSWIKSTVHELLERMIYLLPFDNYVCVSQATKKDLLKIGIPEQKIDVVYNGIDYSFWDPEKVKKAEITNMQNRLNLQDKFVFFCWGRPGASKGFEYAIKAFPHLLERKKDAVLLLMLSSASSYKKKYQELASLAKKINCRTNCENIKIIPSLNREELCILLAAVDCAVIPSVAEGFGFNAAEAAAMEKVIIASDAGSLPEVVSGKHLVFSSKNVDDLAEKMLKAANGEHVKKATKKFEWNPCIEGYLTQYNQLLEGIEYQYF